MFFTQRSEASGSSIARSLSRLMMSMWIRVSVPSFTALRLVDFLGGTGGGLRSGSEAKGRPSSFSSTSSTREIPSPWSKVIGSPDFRVGWSSGHALASAWAWPSTTIREIRSRVAIRHGSSTCCTCPGRWRPYKAAVACCGVNGWMGVYFRSRRTSSAVWSASVPASRSSQWSSARPEPG